MPIGSFVINMDEESREQILKKLKDFRKVTVYGGDEKGHLIIVIESETSEEMEKIEAKIKSIDGVITSNLAYLFYGDEFEKIEKGENKPKIRFGKKRD